MPVRTAGLRVDGRGVSCVEVQQHADEEEHEEGKTVEQEDVRDVRDVMAGQEVHLFFRGAHEEQAGCVQELWEVERLVRVSKFWML